MYRFHTGILVPVACAVLIALGGRNGLAQAAAKLDSSIALSSGVLSSSSSGASLQNSARVAAVPGRIEMGFFAENDFTQRSSGYGPVRDYRIGQTMLPGFGGAVELKRRLGAKEAGSLLFSATPTASALYFPDGRTDTWSVMRYEFDLLWTRSFKTDGAAASPFVAAGFGAIALDGGSDASGGSGWDRQWPVVAGFGVAERLSRTLSIQVETLADIEKASTFSDQTYHSGWTVALRPIAGIVWRPPR